MEIAPLSGPAVLAIGLIVFGAATVKGVAGLGFPLITVPLVANIIGPPAAVVVIAVPTVASNLFMVAQGGGSVTRLRQLAWMIAGLLAGTAVGARALRDISPRLLTVILGIIAVGYAGSALLRLPVRLPSSPRPGVSLTVGAATGLIGGATTIYAPLVSAYVDTMGLARDEFVFWVTALFLIGTSTQVLTYLHAGIYRGNLLWFALLLCLPMLAGTWIGMRVRRRLPPEGFRTLVLVLILLSGVSLLVRAGWR
ncbi:MAG TPA: sulfite exporter TauE/SafE family protein [bacterium]|nr:sulfite exporter TauE/SafE family protein [bacterium]